MGGERGVHVLACVGPAFQPFRNNHPATPRPQDNLKIGQNCRPAVSSASRRPSTLSAHRACSSATGGGREHSAVTPLHHNIAVNGSALPTRSRSVIAMAATSSPSAAASTLGRPAAHAAAVPGGGRENHRFGATASPIAPCVHSIELPTQSDSTTAIAATPSVERR